MPNLPYPIVQVQSKIHKIIPYGHPWIFSGGIASTTGLEPGGLCEIFHRDEFLGIGYWNSHSDIRVRILSFQRVSIDTEFFRSRLKACFHRREYGIRNTNAFRLVNGESDFLPGLIIDIYNGCGVVQIHSLGMEMLKPYILEALHSMDNLGLTCIYEKSDSESRKKEGMPTKNEGILVGQLPDTIHITENSFHFRVDIAGGQKTGFFLDQRENRKSILPYVQNKNVLNCFAYTGGFSVYAASVANHVTTLDISKPAIQMAIENFRLNGYNPDTHNFIAEDAFEYLKNLKQSELDCIIIDPPSMAKNRASIPQAIKAYISLNTMALRGLKNYGILISSSCTTHVDSTTFIKLLHQSGASADCRLQVLESKIQPIDHPYMLSFPEGRYLKFYVLMKVPID